MHNVRSLVGSALAAVLVCLVTAVPVWAQATTGTVAGRITRAGESTPLAGVAVSVPGTGLAASTANDGRYQMRGVPAGPQTVQIRLVGFKPVTTTVTVTANGTVTVDAALQTSPIQLGDVVVQGASRAPEKVVEAPAAISTVDPQVLVSLSATGQLPNALGAVPGVDIVQNGVNDFNVNTRGFNSSLNRRVLVLQDGRDLAVAFLGSQEWYASTQPLEDIGRLEMVRGPGSALYGANAFSGVIAITTPTARETLGGKVTLSGGGLESFRGDARYGAMLGNRSAFRVGAGWSRSDTWARSRTALNGSDIIGEYATSDFTVPTTANGRTVIGFSPERRALNGQTIDPTTGAALGDRAAIRNYYGSGRFDSYLANGGMITLDGGASINENETLLTGIGRVQVTKVLRPWARAAYASDRVNVSAYYNGRSALDPQYSLRSGAPLEEKSNILQLEGQYNRNVLGDKGRVVLGSSVRSTMVNTSGTLMNLANDDRSDWTASVYGQGEYRFNKYLKAVAATRLDDGNLFTAQISPKGALVFTPSERHAFRATYNRAFQTPNLSEFFLQVAAAPPTAAPLTLESTLEGFFNQIRASPAFAAVPIPASLPWNFSAQTQVQALGNANLGVETVDGFEFGYKGELTSKLYVSADVYSNNLKNFVTDLLPGVNGAFPSFGLTDGGVNVPATLAAIDARFAQLGVPASDPRRAAIPQLLAGYNQLLAGTSVLGRNGLATLPNGERAVVLSYTNAGRVVERGLEFGVGYQITPALKLDASYTFFDFDVREQAVGDILLPNTPKHKGNVQLAYADARFDATTSLRLNEGFRWAAGVFQGDVPTNALVNVTAGFRPTSWIRVFGAATNVLNQERYQAFGGAVIGRRILGGVSTLF